MAITTYTILLKNIRTELDEGRRRAEEAVQRHLVATYLKIGQMLHQHIDANTEDDSGRAGYGQGVIQELAVDVGISQQRLYEMLRVYRAFSIFRPAGKLGWTHFVLLASIKDPLERQFYLDQATRYRWSRPHLRAQIQARTHLLKASPESDPLTPRRGRLYTYRILQANDHSITFDLGMHHSATVSRAQLSPNTIPLTSSRGSREDTLPDHLESGRPPRIERRAVSITKNDSTYALTEADLSRLYTYACTVHRIIDGDTIDVRLDYGFGFTHRQRVRLRAIDTPEMNTPDGPRAKAFVEERLVPGDTIVVTTARVGRYGRYVADVFYAKGRMRKERIAQRGRCLNQELVEADLARIV